MENEENEENELCPISMEPIKELQILECGHRFEYIQILQWMESQDESNKQKTCPLCRRKIRSPKEILEEHKKLRNEFIKNEADKRKIIMKEYINDLDGFSDWFENGFYIIKRKEEMDEYKKLYGDRACLFSIEEKLLKYNIDMMVDDFMIEYYLNNNMKRFNIELDKYLWQMHMGSMLNKFYKNKARFLENYISTEWNDIEFEFITYCLDYGTNNDNINMIIKLFQNGANIYNSDENINNRIQTHVSSQKYFSLSN